MDWMETDCSKRTRLEHLGALRIMGDTSVFCNLLIFPGDYTRHLLSVRADFRQNFALYVHGSVNNCVLSKTGP